jgi:hypothetical protein
VDPRRQKEPIIMVDFCKTPAQRDKFRERYGFIDWSKAPEFFDGFNEDVIAVL